MLRSRLNNDLWALVALVVIELNDPPPVGFVERPLHAVGHHIGIEDCVPFEVSRGAAHGLDQRSAGTQEAFLIGI